MALFIELRLKRQLIPLMSLTAKPQNRMKTVLVTGVGKGIGEALMEKFIEEGHFVIGTYHTEKTGTENKNLHLVQLDLTKPDNIGNCVQDVFSLRRKIDILINNAGVLLDEDDTSVINEKLRGTLEVNLIGTIDFTERVIPLMKQGGHI